MANKQATIIKIEELPRLRQRLPKSWIKAAGLLRHKKKALEAHLKKVRTEWDRKG